MFKKSKKDNKLPLSKVFRTCMCLEYDIFWKLAKIFVISLRKLLHLEETQKITIRANHGNSLVNQLNEFSACYCLIFKN